MVHVTSVGVGEQALPSAASCCPSRSWLKCSPSEDGISEPMIDLHGDLQLK